jgi:hypothetical protein
LGRAVAGRSCDAVSPQPASEERLHSERKGAVTQIDTPAEGTLRENFEATDGPTLRRCRPVAVSSRLTPSRPGQWRKLAAARAAANVCHVLQLSSSNAAGATARSEARRELTRTPRVARVAAPSTTETPMRRASRRSVSQLEEAINPLPGTPPGRAGAGAASRYQG